MALVLIICLILGLCALAYLFFMLAYDSYVEGDDAISAVSLLLSFSLLLCIVFCINWVFTLLPL